jgi:hypothetical protein
LERLERVDKRNLRHLRKMEKQSIRKIWTTFGDSLRENKFVPPKSNEWGEFQCQTASRHNHPAFPTDSDQD